MIAILVFDKSSIRLKKGFTITDYIVKRNEKTTSYQTLCEYFNLSYSEVRAIYDRVWNIPLSRIGTLKETCCGQYISDEPPPLRSKNIVLVPTGVDWRTLK